MMVETASTLRSYEDGSDKGILLKPTQKLLLPDDVSSRILFSAKYSSFFSGLLPEDGSSNWK